MKIVAVLAFLILSSFAFGQDPVPEAPWPPQWLIDLKAEKDNEWKDVHKYETLVPKPQVDLPDPVVIGTEEITTPHGGTITVDIIEEPVQPPPPLGFWEEEITEEYVEGKWVTFAMNNGDGTTRSFQSWRPQHKLITHFLSWVSTEEESVVSEGLFAFYSLSGPITNGIIEGAVLTTDRYGIADSAYSFDGVNDRIIIEPPSDVWPAGNSPRSVSVWFFKEVQATSNVDNIFTFGDGLARNQRFSLLIDDRYGFSFVSQGGGLNVKPLPDLNMWHHTVVTYGDKIVTIYLDGEKKKDRIIDINTANDMPLVIGSNSLNRNSEFFAGKIDDIKIYNRVLTPEEVLVIYNAEK